MTAQQEIMKGELLYEFQSRIVSTTIKEISSKGIRLEINAQGEAKGKLDHDGVETADTLLKPDGTFELEFKALKTTKEGEVVVSWGLAKGRRTGLATSFWEGEGHYMTQAPRLSWLNNTTAWVEVTVNRVTGEIQGKAYTKK